MYSSTGHMPHAVVQLAKPEVHPKHPLRNEKSHQTLLEYIKPRLLQGKDARDARLDRMVRVDKSVSAWIKLPEEDRERQKDQEIDGVPRAVQMNLPLSFVQLDDMMTYYSQTFAPNRGMFYQMGKPDEVTPASQIVNIMNNHAIYAGYYRHVLQTIYSTLKYNIGGFSASWSRDIGPKLAKDSTDSVVLTKEVIWEGNKVESLEIGRAHV